MWLNMLVARVRALFRREAVIEDIDEELRVHVEMQTEANLALGMEPDEARRAAAESFGRVDRIRDLAYDVRGGGLLEALWQDLRYAVRALARSPGPTAVAVVTLAVGIGANTAMFGVIDAVLLRPLPYEQPDRLVAITERNAARDVASSPVSLDDALDFKRQGRSCADVALSAGWTFNVTGAGDAERVQGAVVSSNLFPMLGKYPALGRVFSAEEERAGDAAVVVLGDAFWRRRTGADPDVVGRTIVLNGTASTVVGVMPPGFGYPFDDVEIWAPLGTSGSNEDRGSRWLTAVARLAPGVTVEQAQADLDAVSDELERAYPDTNRGWAARVTPLADAATTRVRPALLSLLAAVGFILLIACANVASVLLARAVSRRDEITVRAALGATSGRILRQLLAESLVLALAGGALALATASWVIGIVKGLAPADVARIGEVAVDVRVLSFTLAVSAGTGVLLGLVPAWRASRFDLAESLHEAGRGVVGPRARRLRNLLLVAETALAVVLLVGAGLVIRTLVGVLAVDAGFDPENMLTMQMMLTGPGYATVEQQRAFVDQAIRRVEALPGVESASVTTNLPVGATGGRVTNTLVAEGEGAPAVERPLVYVRAVAPGYFATLRIKVLAGRSFDDRDGASSERVAIVNEALARRTWPGRDPLGRRFRLDAPGAPGTEPPWLTVVGVVSDVKQFGLEEGDEPAVYMPYAQKVGWWRWVSVVVRARSNPDDLARLATAQLHEIDPDQPVYRVQTMDRILSNSVRQRRFNAVLLGALAALALFLTVVGVYGVLQYSVSERTREIGIRMALGGTARGVVGLVLREGLALVGAGVGLGVLGALAVTRFLGSLLYGVDPLDAPTFACVPLLVLAVGVLASLVPARRATRVDPVVLLRGR